MVTYLGWPFKLTPTFKPLPPLSPPVHLNVVLSWFPYTVTMVTQEIMADLVRPYFTCMIKLIATRQLKGQPQLNYLFICSANPICLKRNG